VLTTVLVDTNVLIDVLQDDATWAAWSLQQLRALSRVHRLAINPVIYAELAMSFDNPSALDAEVEALELSFVELSRSALFLAARAHLHYRRRGGTKDQVLADFFIGAHAMANDWTVLTRDAARFRTYFPRLHVIAPEQ